MDFLSSKIDLRKQQNLLRNVAANTSAQGRVITRDNRQLLNFSSNDYLGLANHPDVVSAFKGAVDNYGVGSGSAHLICGHNIAHHQLEQDIASWLAREKAVLFSTGYMANLGVLTSLISRHDLLFQDKLNHSSLIAAGQLTGAKVKRYAHNDLENLRQLLVKSDTRKFIATEGTFSMDGDHPDLSGLVSIAKEFSAHLIVDEAHSIGVLGKQGRGLAAGFSSQDIPVIVGTLGKSCGTFGAFVAGSSLLIENIIQFAASYIYTTAMPPAIAAATSASIKIIMSADDKREHLAKLISYFRSRIISTGLKLLPSNSPIQLLLIGEAESALSISNKLLDSNILVTAIRPPTVPAGSARLRVTFTAEHCFEDVDVLINALKHVVI